MRIGVLRGGGGENQNENYENSLREGGDFISYVFENLPSSYDTVDILIDKNGVWHTGGLSILPAQLLNKVDIVWNFSHPSMGVVLENFSIPVVGTSIFSSLLENNRANLEQHLKDIGVNMPRHIILPLYQEDFDGPRERYAIKKAKEVHEKFAGPWMLKPLTPNSDMAVHVATTFPELVDAMEDGASHGGSVIVEELITGKNVEAHTVSGYRGEEVYAFPSSLSELAKKLHVHLGAKHYLNSNFILHPSGRVYLSNLNFSPNLKENSSFHKSCELVGAGPSHIIEHLLEQAQ